MAMTAAISAKVDEAEEGRIFEVNSLLCGNLAQRGISVREMRASAGARRIARRRKREQSEWRTSEWA